MSLTSPSTLVDWEYLDSTQNTWTRFSDLAASSALENIFLAGNEPTAIITLNGESMTIDLEKMKFKCLDGNVVIFRRISTKSSSDTIYERQDDHEWVPYDCNTCEMLALAENSGRKSITTFVAGVGSPLIAEYCIDFVGKRQINVDTGRGRNIRIKAPLKSASETSTKSSRGFLSSIFSFFDSSTRSSPDGGRCVGSGGTLPASGRVSISSTGTSAGTEVTSSNVDKVLAEAVIGECKEETTCCICMGPFDSTSDEDTSYRLKHCPGHAFHDGCIREYFKYKGSCPCCKYPYIITTGDMPDGTMTWQAYPPGGGKSLSGFQGVGTIEIYYDIPSGVQGPHHENPGANFSGTRRVAYLPDDPDGREVLRLLVTCFERRLTFTVGRSLMRGQENSVIWNAVHHKTSRSGGTSHYGWPDETYFDRVKDELKAKGIF